MVVSVIAASALFSANINVQKKAAQFGSSSIPDSLYMIFKNSCIGCHSDGGNFLAKAKLNFSDWDKYDSKKQVTKAADICKMITEGDMPPKSFRKSNPGAVPTKAQINSICRWADSFSQNK